MAHSEIERQALDACENEPVRTPDSIQPHGCLCVCDLQFATLTHISQNAQGYFGKPAEDILGQALIDVFNHEFYHALRNAAGLRTITKQREYLGVFKFQTGEFQAACHQCGPNFIIGLGKCDKRENFEFDINRLRWLLPRWDLETPALTDALDSLVHDLRTFTKFDRVMAYRFRPDGSGEVISQSLASNTDSYIRLRFPEWDIPKSARAMCLEQPLRFIGDVNAEKVPVLSSSTGGQKVDMTLAELRGASSAHKTYLSNMGVHSSLVVPIVIKGELWGVVSLPVSSLCRRQSSSLRANISRGPKNGHRVERASNVSEAETFPNSIEFDAIILDLFIDRDVDVSHRNQFWHQAFVVGAKVLNQNHNKFVAVWETRQKLLKRFNSAGVCADTHHDKFSGRHYSVPKLRALGVLNGIGVAKSTHETPLDCVFMPRAECRFNDP